jgi:hypothetical protein
MATCAAIGLALSACGDDGGVPVDGGIPDGSAVDAAGCLRTPVTRTVHKVVVSLPYDAAGGPANLYRVLELDAAGALADTGTTFEMGRSLIGELAFTPDGEVGIVPQDDGTLGVVRFDGDTPVVAHAAFAGGFYADRVVIAPAGDLAYVLDNQWRENGGGIHRVAIGCDGTLTDLGRWVESKLPAGLHLDGDRALLIANDVGGSPAGDDVHLLERRPPARLERGDPGSARRRRRVRRRRGDRRRQRGDPGRRLPPDRRHQRVLGRAEPGRGRRARR